jgi:sodium transport system permease protein
VKLSGITVVAEKELRDGFRDRRSLRTILGPLFFGPLVVTFMFHQLIGLKEAAEKVRIPIAGAEFAPALVDWLRQQDGVDVVSLPGDAESAVRNGNEDVVLAINQTFATNFRESRPAPIHVLSDSLRKSAQPKVTRLTALLAAYNAETTALRLIVRGVSPELSAPLKMEEDSVANLQQPAAVLQVVVMFLLVTVLTAGMQIATDSTAGERERRSLEALLLNPVPPWQLITGKWLAASALAFAAMLMNLFIIKFLFGRLPLDQLGGRFRFGIVELLLLVASVGPAALLGPAIQTYLSCSARSFKEAQSYSVFLMLPLIFAGVITMFYPISRTTWLLAIPFLSQYSLANGVLGGQAPSALWLVAVATEILCLSAFFLWLAARRFASEKVILS